MVGFRACPCPAGTSMRVPRSLWMRLLFPSRALYACNACGGRFLLDVAGETNLALRDQAARLSSFHASQNPAEAERPRDPAQAG